MLPHTLTIEEGFWWALLALGYPLPRPGMKHPWVAPENDPDYLERAHSGHPTETCYSGKRN